MALVATEYERVTTDKTGPTYHGNKGSVIIASGVMNTFTGANPAVVNCLATHGIGTITGAVVCYGESVAPALDPNSFSCTWSGSSLNIYRWAVTGSGNATEVASTHDATVNYWVMGTK